LLVDYILKDLSFAHNNIRTKNSKKGLVGMITNLPENTFQTINDKARNLFKNDSSSDDSQIDQKEKKIYEGLPYMLNQGYFDDAFILHEQSTHNLNLQLVVEAVNKHIFDRKDMNIIDSLSTNSDLIYDDNRKELHYRWAKLTNIFRFQPMMAIRNYFGEETAFYFAWLGCLISTLYLPTIIGIIFFGIGLDISIKDRNQSLVLSTNVTGFNRYSAY
jgi:hypothetical protein